jgi:hypothetical protein
MPAPGLWRPDSRCLLRSGFGRRRDGCRHRAPRVPFPSGSTVPLSIGLISETPGESCARDTPPPVPLLAGEEGDRHRSSRATKPVTIPLLACEEGSGVESTEGVVRRRISEMRPMLCMNAGAGEVGKARLRRASHLPERRVLVPRARLRVSRDAVSPPKAGFPQLSCPGIHAGAREMRPMLSRSGGGRPGGGRRAVGWQPAVRESRSLTSERSPHFSLCSGRVA